MLFYNFQFELFKECLFYVKFKTRKFSLVSIGRI